MKFRYFNDQTREYVIQQPNTSLHWINFLGKDKYIGISYAAGGYSFVPDGIADITTDMMLGRVN